MTIFKQLKRRGGWCCPQTIIISMAWTAAPSPRHTSRQPPSRWLTQMMSLQRHRIKLAIHSKGKLGRSRSLSAIMKWRRTRPGCRPAARTAVRCSIIPFKHMSGTPQPGIEVSKLSRPVRSATRPKNLQLIRSKYWHSNSKFSTRAFSEFSVPGLATSNSENVKRS